MSDEPGMWRYRESLPLDPGPVGYPLAVGGTPLLASPALRARLGLPHLFLKDETRGPSSSNKDRATALVIEQSLRAGLKTVTCASTGNVAVSTAVGAAAAGMRAVIFVPAEVRASKLEVMLLCGATVVMVAAGYEAAFTASREAARTFGWADRNTGVNPATVHAKKTVGLEIYEQLGDRAPDVLVAPVGDGPTLVALALAFHELRDAGLIAKMPRIIGVRSADPARTIADGIAVERPVQGREALRETELSGGAMLDVSDAEIVAAMSLLAAGAGVPAEPAGAAATAGLVQALEQGLVSAGETIVVLVTGSAFKTPGSFGDLLEPITIQAGISELPDLG